MSAPKAAGVKVTVIVQELPAARVTGKVPQLLVSVNELALVPVIEIPLTIRASWPVLVRVIDCVAAELPSAMLPKASEVGDRLRLGAGAAPVPLRVTD